MTEARKARPPGNTELFPPAVWAGAFLFVSGQAAVDETGSVVPGTFLEQMDLAISNLARVLQREGLSLADVVQVRAYVHDPACLAEYNRHYPDYFQHPRPARTTLTGCLLDPVKFELDVVAYQPEPARSGGGSQVPDA